MKKWLIRIAIGLVLLLVAIIAYVEFNKESIVSELLDDATADLHGTLGYEDIDVSLLSTLPYIGISLIDVILTTKETVDNNPLLEAEKISVKVDLVSALKGNQAIQIKKVELDGVKANLSISKEGVANYNIYESDNSSTSETNDLDLEEVSITNSQIRYTDHSKNTSYLLKDIQSKSKIEYRSEAIKVASEIASTVTIDLGPVSPNYSLDLDGKTDLNIATDFTAIDVMEGLWSINELPVDLKGTFKENSNNYDYDLVVESPKTDVKDILSLLPSVQRDEYAKMISKGKYQLTGKIYGSTADAYPKYDIQLDVDQGQINHPDLSQNIDRLDLKGRISNQSGSRPYTTINLEEIDLKSGQSFLVGSAEIDYRGNHHLADIDLSGDIDLKEVAKALLIDQLDDIEGQIKGRLDVEVSLSEGQELSLDNEDLEVDIHSEELKWNNNDTPIRIQGLNVNGTGSEVSAKVTRLDYGQVISNVSLDFFLPSPLDIVYGKEISRIGTLQLKGDKVNLNNLTSTSDTIGNSLVYPIPKIKIKSDLHLDTFIYDEYHVHQINGEGILDEISSKISFTIEELNGGKFAGDANLAGIWSYMLNSDTLTGALNLKSDLLDIKRYMSQDTVIIDTQKALTLAPTNLDLAIDYSVDAIKYGRIDILKSLGNIGLRNGNVILESQGDILGGKILFTTELDAKQKDRYHINLDMKVEDLAMGETAQKLSTLSEILPIASLLQGTYDAVLKWESDLDRNYVPNLNSVTAYGEVLTKEGKIIGKLPGQELLDDLVLTSIDKALDIANTKKYFFIKDGRVAIQDVILKKDDIEVTIGGSHGLNNDLAYDLKLHVPKEKWRGLGNATTQLAKTWTDKIGLSDISEDLVFEVSGNLLGSIKEPAIEITGVHPINGGSGQTVQDIVRTEVNEKVDSVQTVITDSIKHVETTTREKIEDIKDQVITKVDSTREAIEEVADSTIASLEDLISAETADLRQEGAVLLDSLKQGNVDSLLSRIKILIDSKGKKLDSLKLPGNIKNQLPFLVKKKPKG